MAKPEATFRLGFMYIEAYVRATLKRAGIFHRFFFPMPTVVLDIFVKYACVNHFWKLQPYAYGVCWMQDSFIINKLA